MSDSLDSCRPGLPVHHQLLELAQTHVHWVGDIIQPFHPLSSLLFLPSIFPCIRVFSNESALHIRWPKYWNFSFSISPSNEYSGLISFRIDWFDLLAVQGTLKSFLQHHSLKVWREHSPAHQQKIGLKIYWAWLHPSEQDPDSPTVSLSHQEAFPSLYPYPSEGRQNENHSHRKLTKLITWITALSNSIRAMPCRATQNGWVMVESSDKTWSTGEVNGKPLQYSCLENPVNSMKICW